MKKVKKEWQVGSFESRVAVEARSLGLFQRAGLAAVSGGADSLALVLGLAAVGVEVQACCVDHGLRVESAAEGQAVVAQLRGVGIECHVLRIELADGPGVEARARQARYAALETTRVRLNAAWVATGHTANDQAETVLFRLGRGASLAGARGIHRSRGALVRPLLGLTRGECVSYVAARGLVAAYDPMNADVRFSRVRIRQQTLPSLETVTGPGTVHALARFAQHAAADEAYLAAEARAALGRVLLGSSLERVAFLALAAPIARRVLALWLATRQVEVEDSGLLDRALAAIGGRHTTPLPGDQLLTCKKGRVEVGAAPARLH